MDCHWTTHWFSSWTPPLWIVIERTISYLIVSLTTTYIFQGKHFVNIIFASATGLLLLLEKKQEIVTFYIGVYCLKINCTILSRSLPATSGAAAQGAECIRPGVNTSRRALRVFYLECAVPKAVHHMRASEASRQRSLRQLCCNELHRSYNVYSYLYIHCTCITLLTENKHLCHIWGIIDTL